jgi:aconitate hydratase
MIPYDSPATEWLRARGVEFRDFNTFGSRRGNHEVMMRGTFGNIRIRNRLAPGTEGGYTRHLPDGETMSIYDAAMNYAAEGTPFVVLAGKDYGMGVLPLQFDEGQSAERLGLTGEELLDIEPSSRPGQEVTVTVRGGGPSGESKTFQAISRIDTSVEMEYCHNEGILHALLRSMPP